MVYMKKGTPAKNQQQQIKKGKSPKGKQAEEADFEDMDDSTVGKGRQSMNRKVSFSIPGKNSPAVKTPKKDTSILAKKQPTPANKSRTSMQGIKNQEDDDEDDSEDDEFDMEEGDDMDEEGDDLDLDLDDEEGDSEEEDDDDDEEDDDDDEDKVDIQKKLSLLKQTTAKQNKQKTPVKGNDKAKTEESPAKAKTPKKEQVAQNPELGDEAVRRRERDAKMLYIGDLPKDATVEELKKLSSDIVDVTIPLGNRKHPVKTMFGFLCFNTEAKAEANYKTLQSKKFRGQPLKLDFAGYKSKNKKVDESKVQYNLKKLFVPGIPADGTMDLVAKHFKKAFQITINQYSMYRTAMIGFENEEDCKEAHDANKEIIISGHKLPVLYSRQGQSDFKKKPIDKSGHVGFRHFKRNGEHHANGGNPAKKMKFVKSEE